MIVTLFGRVFSIVTVKEPIRVLSDTTHSRPRCSVVCIKTFYIGEIVIEQGRVVTRWYEFDDCAVRPRAIHQLVVQDWHSDGRGARPVSKYSHGRREEKGTSAQLVPATDRCGQRECRAARKHSEPSVTPSARPNDGLGAATVRTVNYCGQKSITCTL